jgi:hypothetical protein
MVRTLDPQGDRFVLKRSAKKNTKAQSSGPLFVLGVPRSGTSLLYVMLNQHPEIRLMYEADLPMLWPLFLRRPSKLQWLERWNLYNEGPQRHQLDLSRIPSDLTDIPAATAAAYGEFARQESAHIWGDKTPNQFDGLLRLAAQFPQARFILIWRDPADVCRSIIRARTESIDFKRRGSEGPVIASPHFIHGGLTHRALLGYRDMGAQRDRLRAQGIPVHELHYNDLVANPAAEMQKICHFLSILYYHSMTTLKDADNSAIPTAQHNAMAKGDNIVATKKRTEVLPVGLKRKIERYKNLWRQQGLDWANFPVSTEERGVPSQLERTVDRIRYRCLRVWDRFVVFGFCVAPLRWLLAYRSGKKHQYLNSTWQDYVRGFESKGAKEDSIRLPLASNEARMPADISR